MRSLWFISAVGQGHVARCRPLIAALQDRGHACAAAIVGGRAARLVEDLCPVLRPAPRAAASTTPRPSFRARSLSTPAFAAMRDLEMTMAVHQGTDDAAVRAAQFVSESIDRLRPDVVVVDQMVLAGPIAHARGLPVVQVSSGPMLIPELCWTPLLAVDPRVRCPPQLPHVNEALNSVGVDRVAGIGELVAGDLLVVPTPVELGTHPDALHVRLRPELPHEPRRAQLGRSKRRIAILMGNVPRLADPPVRAALTLGMEVLVFEHQRLALEPELLANHDVVPLPTVDPAEWLPDCDAVVHHAGAGSLLAGVLAGVPALMIPSWTEQALNAAAAEDRGAGIAVPASLAHPEPLAFPPSVVTLGHREPDRAFATRVREAIERIEEPEFTASTRAWREELLGLAYPLDAVLSIERLAERARAA